ncbi:MAG: class I SAM-dependent methyltransferase, partial [Salinibacter sp.]
CQETADLFDWEKAQTELRKYRKSGPPNKCTRLLIDGLKPLDLQDKTLLDVGGGIGMIPLELLEEGISDSVLVEASPAYLEVAEDEARRRGFENRTAFEHGDFVDLAPDLPDADLVTLDRVFCCYPHMEELARTSAAKATRWYAVTSPKERWYNKIISGMAGVYCWARDMD